MSGVGSYCWLNVDVVRDNSRAEGECRKQILWTLLAHPSSSSSGVVRGSNIKMETQWRDPGMGMYISPLYAPTARRGVLSSTEVSYRADCS
jgi:hypothetical protein